MVTQVDIFHWKEELGKVISFQYTFSYYISRNLACEQVLGGDARGKERGGHVCTTQILPFHPFLTFL